MNSPKKLSRSDLRELGAGLVLFAVVGVSLSGLGDGIRSWAYPTALTYLLATIGTILIGRRLLVVALRRAPSAETGSDAEAEAPAAEAESDADTGDRGATTSRRVTDIAVITGVAVLFAILIPVLGFWLTSFLAMGGLAIFLSDRKDVKRIGFTVLIVAAVCVGGYLLFLHVFYVPVPLGLLLF